MKSKLSSLAVGWLLAIGTVSQASPSFAEVYTQPFTTPIGEGIFSYDSNSRQSTYSLSNPSTSYYVSGVSEYDINTWRGSNYGTFQEATSYGTYWQNYPLGSLEDLNNYTFNYDPNTNTTTWTEGDPNSSFFRVGTVQYDSATSQGTLNTYYRENRSTGTYSQQFGSNVQPVASGNSFSYDPATNRITWSQNDPSTSTSNSGVFEYDPNTSMATVIGTSSNSGASGTYSQQFPMTNPREPEIPSPFPGTVARRFVTPQADGVYAYDIANHRLIYALGDPNSSFFSTGGFTYDVNTGEGDVLITYQNDGTRGGYTRHFSSSNVQAVPEPTSPILNTLAFGAVLGAGLMLKRQKKKRLEIKD